MSRLTETAKLFPSDAVYAEIALMAEILELPDPEPRWSPNNSHPNTHEDEGKMHIAWRQRQEARKKLTEWLEAHGE